MEPISIFSSRIVGLPNENIDTDQIIPARFLKTTSKIGLGANLFSDWRYLPDGSPNPDFVLNRADVQGARVLVAGNNFGCGSSREHAPWALHDFGFRAVVSTYFGDIFRNNALKNGLLTVVVDPDTLAELHRLFDENPNTEVTVDLESQELRLPDGRAVNFPIEPFAKHCLLQGVDQLGFLVAQDPLINAYETSHGKRVDTTPVAAGVH